MDYLPVFFRLQGQQCLLVGGGEVAMRKLRMLLKAGAKVRVVAETVNSAVTEMINIHALELCNRRFLPEDMEDCRIVVAATNDHESNRQIQQAAQRLGIPVNVVDTPELCDFIFPAIIDRSPLLVAVSSGGTSPVLARWLRARLEAWLPHRYGHLARFAERFRPRVKQVLTEPNARRVFWENVLQGPIAETVLAGREKEAEAALEDALADGDANTLKGEVYLIGAGPGDPDLLTFKALRLLQQADVVVYDHLVNPEILELARRDAERIYAGKQRKQHTLPQPEINRLLIDLARSGLKVARLKGGDPFIFGRGGEEIESLMALGITFQVVPGITAASGCAAYAGIPLTHRDHAQSCVFVTGHLQGDQVNLDWRNLVKPNQTVVIYMGLMGLPSICRQLIAHGAAPDYPVAIIQQGTTADQKVVVGTLSDLPEKCQFARLKAPTLIIIGTVVKLHSSLGWYSEKNVGSEAL